MSHHYTIGDLARHADVPASTLRYYERRGLLRADARSRGNYRLYGEESLRRLRFVRSAQTAGFTLSDICSLLDFREAELEPCSKVQSLIEVRLDQVREERSRLQQVEKLLQQWLRDCRSSRDDRRCGVLEVLATSVKQKT